MSFTLNIATDNAAFHDAGADEGDDTAKRAEVSRILRLVANKLAMGDDHGVIHDINGNRIGNFST